MGESVTRLTLQGQTLFQPRSFARLLFSFCTRRWYLSGFRVQTEKIDQQHQTIAKKHKEQRTLHTQYHRRPLTGYSGVIVISHRLCVLFVLCVFSSFFFSIVAQSSVPGEVPSYKGNQGSAVNKPSSFFLTLVTFPVCHIFSPHACNTMKDIQGLLSLVPCPACFGAWKTTVNVSRSMWDVEWQGKKVDASPTRPITFTSLYFLVGGAEYFWIFSTCRTNKHQCICTPASKA